MSVQAQLPATVWPRADLPARSGLGLKSAHYKELLASLPDLGFFEVHAENYMVAGGPFQHYLQLIRERYALSVHGVGLSIGGSEPLDQAHLDRLDELLRRYQPQAFSEHLAWSSHGGVFFNDLLPLPYNSASLERVCAHVDQVQSRLQRTMLLENPAAYLGFNASTMDEGQFLSEVVRRTGCGLLLDLSNLYVSSVNQQHDPLLALQALPLLAVGEIHLAGFSEDSTSSAGSAERLLIDSHAFPVDLAVWTLYERVLGLIGPQPTLIERDSQLPALSVLLAEAHVAEKLLQRYGQPQVLV